jgi:hypothetical protein
MLRWTCFLILAVSCFAQFDPEGAHVDLYFPHLADGGPVQDQWQTAFVFVNPHPSIPANVVLSMFGNDGQPLALDLGGGGKSVQAVTVPPSGSVTLRSSISFPTTYTGYAFAASDLPLQATVLFRRIMNGVPQAEISAAATLPSQQYFSPATRDLGVAMVNLYDASKSFQITALDSNGVAVGTSAVNLAAHQHLSFNLSDRIPSLPASFTGSVKIVPSAMAADQFLAWTLNADRGLVASLPSGRLAWPISHADRIWLVYRKLVAAAPAALASLAINDVNLNAPGVVTLAISAEQVINAFGRPGVVQIDLSLSQLISDSPGELAFIVGHELGHVAQFQHGKTLTVPDAEQDADLFAMTLMILAGFDPYAGAGALAKLNMATGKAGLLAATFDDLADPHSSFTTRLDSMFSDVSQTCAQSALTGLCGAYKLAVHPNFPASAPF